MSAGDLIVVGHTLVHLRQLAFQRPRRAVEHHQHRRRAERPSSVAANTDRRARHLRAGAAVQPAHGADVVVAQKAHNEVALAQQVAALPLRHLRVLLDGRQQQRLQRHHPGYLPPREHPPHQHQQRQRMRLEHPVRALVQRRQHLRRVQRCQQYPRVRLHHPQQPLIVPAAPIGRHGVQILPMPLIPRAAARLIERPLFRAQRLKAPLGALLHHVMEAIRHAVRQPLHEGVLRRQRRQYLPRVSVPGDEARHVLAELVRQSHHRQKLPLPLRQRIDHGRRERGIDVRPPVGQRPLLMQRPQVQIHRGEPPLAGVQQLLHLRVGQLRAAPMGIHRQLRVVQPQLLRADLIHPRAQPHRLGGGQKAIPAGHDQVHVAGQPPRQRTQERRHAPVSQQVKIVQKQVARHIPCQLVAQVVRQHTPPNIVRRAVVLPQEAQPGPGKGVLRTAPQDGQVVGIHADADDPGRLRPDTLVQIPAHRRGLPVAHRRDHGGHGAAGDRPQALLQPLGYVGGVQIPFRLWHAIPLRYAAACFSVIAAAAHLRVYRIFPDV